MMLPPGSSTLRTRARKIEVVRTVCTVLVCWSSPLPSTTTAGLIVATIRAACRIFSSGTQVMGSTFSGV